MTYPPAQKAFELVIASDPDGAVAHWGSAMTLVQPLGPPRPSPDALHRGWDAVQRATALDAPTARDIRQRGPAAAGPPAPAPPRNISLICW